MKSATTTGDFSLFLFIRKIHFQKWKCHSGFIYFEMIPFSKTRIITDIFPCGKVIWKYEIFIVLTVL